VFESLIESRADRRTFWRLPIVMAAIGLHLAVLAGIWVQNLFEVPPIPEPVAQVTFARFAPPPPPPPPAPPKPAAPKPVAKVQPPMPKELVQPEKTPEVVPLEPAPEPPSDATGGVEGGVEGGVAGGVPGGIVDSSEPLRVGGDVTPPEIVDRTPPQYTVLARNARVEGIVILEAIIRRDGTVGDIKILRDLPLGLGAAAVEAVRSWRFRPGTMHGVPVDVYYTLTVQFRLQK
jgi:protein TonB